MSRFSDQDRAKIFAESRRLLKDDDRPVPPVAREPLPEIVFEDPVAKWKREADEAEAERAAERRRERVTDRLIYKQATDLASALEERIGALEARMDAVEQALAGFDALANGTVEFSNATTTRVHALAALTDRLDRTLEQMRETHKRECDGLRDRLAASEATHARETAMLTRELASAQREIDRRADVREHVRNRMAVVDLDEKVENVVALVREDIRQHQR
jgi:hypothetical protein